MNFKAVVFDLDGTLLDTLDDIANSMNSILTNAGYPAHPKEAYRYFIGEGLEALVRKTLPEKDSNPENIAKYFGQMKTVYHERWNEKTKPYEGIKETLKELNTKNIPVCVFSNKAHEFTSMMVNELLAEYEFAVVKGSFPGIPKKPDPTVALAMAKELNVLPQNILYIGDTDTDMQTANNAGFYPVGALWGFRTADELTTNGAKTLIKHPLEILKLLT